MANSEIKKLFDFQFHGECEGMKGLIGISFLESGEIKLFFTKEDDAYGDYSFSGTKLEIIGSSKKVILHNGSGPKAECAIDAETTLHWSTLSKLIRGGGDCLENKIDRNS